MAYNKGILLGRITKISGYEGAVTVKLEKLFSENIPQMESVFLEIEGRPVPFFISYSEYSGADILKMMFEGYDSISKVNEFVGCRVFLTSVSEENMCDEKSENIIGFKVFLQNKKLIGTIEEIIQNPGQDLLKIVSSEKKEILVPFHEDFILRFNLKRKTIIVVLPEGLTDLN